MCRVLEVSRSGYYAYCAREESPQRRQSQVLLSGIRAIFEDSGRTYGVRRIERVLRTQAICAGRNRIWRLMREGGLRVKTRRRFKVTTNADHKRPVAPDLVRQDFTARAPDRLWSGDITYIWTAEGWVYLAVVLDVFSRRIVGWSMMSRMKDDLEIAAFNNALLRRGPKPGLVFHSDRGSQYCSSRYRELICKAGGRQSMSATGSCYDNAITEFFLGTLKRELVHHFTFSTRQEAKSQIFAYIEGFYNRQRLHSVIGYLSPEQFEQERACLAA